MGEINDILPIIEGDSIRDIGIFTEKVEYSIKLLVRSNKRFRHALSEHLAFWIQFAEVIQSDKKSKFTLTPPNFLPEDNGPDGLSLSVNDNSDQSVEIRSVKSSIVNPYYLIASASFRQTGERPNPNKLLEEFFLISKEGYGFVRLDRLVASAFHSLDMPADQFLRGALLQNFKTYNAVVVADARYSNYETFSCFHFVSLSPEKCIATYIGSDHWLKVAEQIRIQVLKILRQSTVW